MGNKGSIPGLGRYPKKEMTMHSIILSFPGGSDGKESACNAEDLGSTPESGRTSGSGNDNPLQYSYLENPMDRLVGYSPRGHSRAQQSN